MELVLHRQTQLALAAFGALARAKGRLSRAELADGIGTSIHYLPQVIRPLIDSGWVDSQRGPTGGYELAADPGQVSLLDVVEAVEGPMAGRCVSTGAPCPSNATCPFHATWSEVQLSLQRQLGRQTMRPKKGSPQ